MGKMRRPVIRLWRILFQPAASCCCITLPPSTPSSHTPPIHSPPHTTHLPLLTPFPPPEHHQFLDLCLQSRQALLHRAVLSIMPPPTTPSSHSPLNLPPDSQGPSPHTLHSSRAITSSLISAFRAAKRCCIGPILASISLAGVFFSYASTATVCFATALSERSFSFATSACTWGKAGRGGGAGESREEVWGERDGGRLTVRRGAAGTLERASIFPTTAAISLPLSFNSTGLDIPPARLRPRHIPAPPQLQQPRVQRLDLGRTIGHEAREPLDEIEEFLVVKLCEVSRGGLRDGEVGVSVGDEEEEEEEEEEDEEEGLHKESHL
ncbi:unnamed protein product [Closterium sp. Naga37s-1]|nr:unnamed protein product [Closterium sp. Naga37s-1]